MYYYVGTIKSVLFENNKKEQRFRRRFSHQK